MNFVKLKNNLEVNEYDVHDLLISFGVEVDGQFKGIKYSAVTMPIKDTILSMIPLEHRKYFDISVMQVNTGIPPHTDSNISATINFYIKTDNCLTQFYSLKTDSPTTSKIENQTNGSIFGIIDLNKEDSFLAKPSEAWLLDVSKPHSVIPGDQTPIDRIAICLQSRKFNFEETKEFLRITGNL